MWATRCRSMIRWHRTFKVLYLQDFRPNPETYHPIWGVSTKDAASYTSMGEVIPTGTAAEA